jgi:hypothetical protein
LLSIRGFWRDFSRRQFRLGIVDGLSEALSYAALFDQLFGKLARHRIVYLSERQIEVNCLHCYHVREASGNDVCETHIGILQGQFERRFGHNFQAERSIKENVCRLQLLADLHDHEK